MSEGAQYSVQPKRRRYIFGATTSIITNLGLIAGLYFTPDAKLTMIGSILVIALADNISDSLGMHIYQEAENLGSKEVWTSTLANFLTRLVISLIFVVVVIFLPVFWAALYLTLFGLILLGFISYFIAKRRHVPPHVAIIEHIAIALLVIVVSKGLGYWISTKFKV